MRFWPLLKPILPNRYLPYIVPGGRIYLNIKESPMMLARVFRQYETPKRLAIQAMLKPGMTFVDIGTNKGDFALLAAAVVGSSGQVLCFEPEPVNCYWVRKSIELNGYRNVKVHEFALGDANEETQLYLGRQSGWHTLLPSQPDRDRGSIPITKRTLDSVLSEAKLEKIDVMKIDVEGAEMAVLRGAVETLKRNSDMLLLMDLHPSLGINPVEVCKFLHGFGFSVYEMRPPYDQPLKVHEETLEVLARFPGFSATTARK
jgi:FkbM family methyltransferase